MKTLSAFAAVTLAATACAPTRADLHTPELTSVTLRQLVSERVAAKMTPPYRIGGIQRLAIEAAVSIEDGHRTPNEAQDWLLKRAARYLEGRLVVFKAEGPAGTPPPFPDEMFDIDQLDVAMAVAHQRATGRQVVLALYLRPSAAETPPAEGGPFDVRVVSRRVQRMQLFYAGTTAGNGSSRTIRRP